MASCSRWARTAARPVSSSNSRSAASSRSSSSCTKPPGNAHRPRCGGTPPGRPGLWWFVREAWPSPATGTDLTEGTLGPDQRLVVAESDLVLFGDGIESDAIPLTWGQRATFTVAERQLRLVA